MKKLECNIYSADPLFPCRLEVGATIHAFVIVISGILSLILNLTILCISGDPSLLGFNMVKVMPYKKALYEI